MKTDARFQELEQWLINKKKTPNTIKTYKNVLKNFQRWLELQDKELLKITQEDIQHYINYLETEGKSASTIDKVYATIRVFVQFINRPHIITNIKRKEKEKSIYQVTPDFLTEEEKFILLKKVKNDQDLRNIAIVYILLDTGIRVSELCNLDICDVIMDGNKGVLHIQGDRERKVPMSEEVISHVRYYLETIENYGNHPLFSSKHNKRLTTRAIQYMLEKYQINSYKLRHTFCRTLIEKGLDVSVIAQLVGHSDLNMTKRYKTEKEKKIKIC